ncbi:glycoside hydrolase family 3 C-terminal domain-containing protein [Natronosporangium hydrolyticum]|uniref:Glycoside hydrolase family 3 C-terminal domain-containing protein n=2 Tax=Natronosporangium hydrolyticum TaxID=2811111 RepID=A0A895YRM2_9ACTN|nr:glycoside hydrolase family 3 C-terminal domain-containing protein [Natronosporangium hydrolyticum]
MATDNERKPWQQTDRPAAARVADLLAELSLEEKVAQLYGVWAGVETSGDDVAPHQHELADPGLDLPTLLQSGLGQLTRPFGTAPVDPTEGAKALARLQADVVAGNRFGIPALVHEECLTGFMTWQATIYPTPLAWGASFDAPLVAKMATEIGAAMHSVGVHQGLSPVMDVARDLRWGRVEETVGEDPYLVGTIGSAYVSGLQSAGVLAALKHFVGYSASVAGRNHGPISIGPRELADVLLPPFEMALQEGGADSVMASYSAIDGVPSHGDYHLLTTILRQEWGFTGTVVSDYFGVTFLELNQAVAGSSAEAARSALTAGVDVELPTVRCYGQPLIDSVRAGELDESLVDLAVTRVLLQKCELGLLDPDWNPLPPALREPGGEVDFDPPGAQETARILAEESVILLRNEGVLPLTAPRIAVVGELADETQPLFGCYAFPNHGQHQDDATDEHPAGEFDTVLAALHDELPDATISFYPVTGGDLAGAVAAAEAADVVVAVVGDRSGLFGRGTSGEGCDAADLQLPYQQEQLLAALTETATPVVAVLLTGRPYALGAVIDRLAAAVQAFFPGQAGGAAIAGVLSGRVNPSGRLPVSIPSDPGGQPGTYLAPQLGRRTEVSSIDPTPLFPFGYGLSYTSFSWDEVTVAEQAVGTDGTVSVSVRVRNTGPRAGVEVVQLYLHDPVAQVALPVVRLVGFARVPLAAGESRLVTLTMPTDLASFTGRDGQRIVEPGSLELRLGRSCEDIEHTATVELVGPQRVIGHRRRFTTEVTIG